MFRIHRIFESKTTRNTRILGEIHKILKSQFPLEKEQALADMLRTLNDPFYKKLRTFLLLAENHKGDVLGFAVIHHAPDLEFCYLDYIATAPGRIGGGIGSALYERVRDECRVLDVVGLFFECLPDDPKLSPDPKIREQNKKRLRFYERYGARPVAGTLYETPVTPGDTDPPYLVFDDLDQGKPLPARTAQLIVRAILERKYRHLNLAPVYIDTVVHSFRDDPVRLRPPHYKQENHTPQYIRKTGAALIPLVVSEKHRIHQVPDRGYVESPVRISSIMKQIEPTGLFEKIPAKSFGRKHKLAVHSADLVNYIEKASKVAGEKKYIYPYVFPIRNPNRKPDDLPTQAGYYCIDTFTPINLNAYLAANEAVDCALTAAEQVLMGKRFAYALVRPPGHHAESKAFGGFCYFNNNAIAAHYMSQFGKVAILDIDYHHGNGQQEIFYKRSDVLTISVHGHPSFAYPYFTGFEWETGSGAGAGYNRNYPLPESITADQYFATLDKAFKQIKKFAPEYLIIALGLDTAKADPTGTWPLHAKDFHTLGKIVCKADLPTLVVQEGGYRTRTLGTNARHFFTGLAGL